MLAACVGVDGCRTGWVVATRTGVHVARAIDEVIARPYAVVAIDMPIGLPAATARRSELEARRYLSPRGSTIFPTPVRACLAAADYREACAISSAARGVKLSMQTWHIVPKIREVDEAISAADSARVVEAHPECSFVCMNGGRRLVSKHTPTGVTQRAELVHTAFGIDAVALARGVRGAALDDVLDAFGVLWTAERFAAGEHRVFPADGAEVDDRGLPMRIVM